MNWASYSGIKDAILFALAIYAAFLSTLNFLQSRRKDQRSIRILTSTVMPTFGPELGPPHMKIEAVNAGHRVVTISAMTLELPNKSRLATFLPTSVPLFPDTPLPARLEQGDVAHRTFPYSEIGQALLHHGHTQKIKLTPVCDDTVGGHHFGEPWEIDPYEFIRMGRS